MDSTGSGRKITNEQKHVSTLTCEQISNLSSDSSSSEDFSIDLKSASFSEKLDFLCKKMARLSREIEHLRANKKVKENGIKDHNQNILKPQFRVSIVFLNVKISETDCTYCRRTILPNVVANPYISLNLVTFLIILFAGLETCVAYFTSPNVTVFYKQGDT